MCLDKIICRKGGKRRKMPSTKNSYYCLIKKVYTWHASDHIVKRVLNITAFISLFDSFYYKINVWYDALDGLKHCSKRAYTNCRQYYTPYFHVFTTIEDAEKYRQSVPCGNIIVKCKIKNITCVGLQDGLFTVIARHRKIVETIEAIEEIEEREDIEITQPCIMLIA